MASSNKGIKFFKGKSKIDFTYPFVRLCTLKKGEIFTLDVVSKASPSQVFILGDFNPLYYSYLCYKYRNYRDFYWFSGNKLVYRDFIF